MQYPVTLDGKYFVVRGRLWRCSNPGIAPDRRAELTRELMAARRTKGIAIRNGDDAAKAAARTQIEAAKAALGERGSVWWTDGTPDYNRHMARNTPYADWFSSLSQRFPK